MIRRTIGKLLQVINRATLCPMALRPFRDIRSPEALQAVVDAGWLRQAIMPVEPDLTLIRNVVVFAPHQDDESIGCGGLLARLAGSAKITVVFVTDGAADNLGVSLTDSIALRRGEALRALEYVGATSRFLDLPNVDLTFDDHCINEFRKALIGQQPDLILAPWMFDRPEKHRLCSAALCEALKQLPHLHGTPLWGYQVHNCLFPNVVIDITEFVDIKTRMIQCHRSQIQSVAPFDHHIIGMNQWNARYLT
ncbi:MAG: PIG-L family deacetylase, partial [Fuerstiella sp.]|nr:PIG-L family deacetylase [Fuerstiella sp.]